MSTIFYALIRRPSLVVAYGLWPFFSNPLFRCIPFGLLWFSNKTSESVSDSLSDIERFTINDKLENCHLEIRILSFKDSKGSNFLGFFN